MKISLLTDAPKHNLALMKISSHHKAQGHEVFLGNPLEADKIYASWLFDYSPKYAAHEVGGPGISYRRLPPEIDQCWPDYRLFGLDYSLGYTWEYCPRKCPFCVVPKFATSKVHYSIWEFHDSLFNKICLLNNNTFSDSQWRVTFEEIWGANLTVIDENGFDLRLLDEEKAEALKRTRFEKQIHFAWDCMEDERVILRGLELAEDYKLDAMIYVLTGFDTTLEEDLYRCQKITDKGFDPYVMPYNARGKQDSRSRRLRKFKRFIDSRCYRPNVFEAWEKWTDK